ncbi:baseplate multidomain protein megatron [Rhodovulum euryhalinum]|uniref:Putative tail protein n=1 Tax=Rhodovulum euryhalinum TaxID=35805 RepID=A0A4R2KW28_9RHOB|nr:glycoside hydrolase/phage tail family protein [Rhodovulum euryhalinum]TCO70905.1 putative tail protein [Rhodovulum euryhalinum]
MATIVLSAAGAAAGSALGGSVLGLSSAVIGRAIGATVGRAIDQQLLGTGSQAIETGRVERFRLTGASEGAPVGRLWGRSRLAGQVIWASRFKESVATSGGGKGAPSKPKLREYSYSVSLAIALCEGEIARVGRVWADGTEIAPDEISLRVYSGSAEQLPDPLIEAVEGMGQAPAYRGIAYVVIEDLDLGRFGNRVPQFSFEVVRAAAGDVEDLAHLLQGVALIPGTGEYALATTPVHFQDAPGVARSANVNTPGGKTDLAVSLEKLRGELPRIRSVSLVVSWFAGDLRAGIARIRPGVEQSYVDGTPLRWSVAGLSRGQAPVIPRIDGRAVYGGTPSDQSVIEAIRALAEGGQEAVFYPFILMDQLQDNALTDPYSGEEGQPHLPWRGRITLSYAPGHPLSPDGTHEATAEVAEFFGSAVPDEFTFDGQTVRYGGSDGWSYRRFILHYAHLCAAAGGVGGFCIGSELRGLTTIRGPGNSFPAVEALRALAADVRAVLPDTKIGYAADWSEYFGYHPAHAPGDVFFHLDPLWADPNVDFVGIDNYMPLSDWREGETHADADWGAIHALDYLKSNIEGGEGFDWYYPSREAREAQTRVPITDGAHDEPWIWRYKDIRSWWQTPHHDRVGGVRQETATPWVPRSKPIWFTEFGCAAVDKGTNAPNLFVDPKSSENALPPHSTGARDDLIQHQYLRAVLTYWADPVKNPVSEVYGGPMIDLSRAHAWAWDARPFPHFPGNRTLWADGDNYARGHWLNGRASAQALDAVVTEICAASGVNALDVSRLYGLVRGYLVSEVEGARAALQPLMLAYGAEAAEREGRLVFFNRDGRPKAVIEPGLLAVTDDLSGEVEHVRSPEAETAGRVRLSFVESDGAYETRAAEAILPDENSRTVSSSELPLVLTGSEGQAVVERWLAEARVACDRARLALAPSTLGLGAGDVLRLPGGDFRIDRVDLSGAREIEAVRVERGLYLLPNRDEAPVRQAAFMAPVPVCPLFLDLPLLTGDEVPHAPHLAVAAQPWPGTVAVYSSVSDAGYELNTLIGQASVIGVTETALAAARPARWDRGAALRVKLSAGALSSVGLLELFAGANAAAIGDGSPNNWEVFQFAEAALVAPLTYDLRIRLRGQAGTDGVMPALWPEGSRFVLLDGRPGQIDLPLSARGLGRHYRIGPGLRPFDDSSFIHLAQAFDGIGLRPFAPCHLVARSDGQGGLAIRWTRRSRIDGDSWASVEVPLGEDREAYHVRVIGAGGEVLREATPTAPRWTYTAAMRAADAGAGPAVVEVAQLSDQFGPGPYQRIKIDE